MNASDRPTKCIEVLSQLLLSPGGQSAQSSGDGDLARTLSALRPQEFDELWSLANSHHVIARTFPKLHEILLAEKHERADWARDAMIKEKARIDHALSFLFPICEALKEGGDVIVIKSLDHWPDLGNDLDLYSNATPSDIVAIMSKRFNARPDARSWGDRLANKWNFIVPGLPELVEVHVSRLGQTGEQVTITNSLVTRACGVEFGSGSVNGCASKTFPVPAPEDRLIISTLQRMYRHFYLRLCDIVDTARLVDSGVVDYAYVKSLAQSAGLWDGIATYLATVSGYVKSYRGTGLPLPSLVTDSARFGNELVHFRKMFL